MCGIAGVIHDDRTNSISLATLLAMRDSMTHRGPDDAGHYLAPGVGLASRRLAILDLSERGHMPMSTPDGRYHIVHNGEVYNYRELREPLRAKGYTFRSNSDTEVLLNLFASEGPGMLDRLNGMFAFAVWDAQERSLFLARDRLGIKPIYYAHFQGALYFGSEEKALFIAGVPAEFNAGTWEELLCFGYVAGEPTPFVNVKRLLPGHFMVCKNGQLRIQRWWNLGERARERREFPPRQALSWFEETFYDAVGLRRISDVPIGVLLSGGLDSSSIASRLALQAESGVASFTVRFSEAGYDEGPLARQVAERWKLKYHELTVTSDELMLRLRQAAWFNDEPLAHASDLYVAAISSYAKPRVTVLLSGEGSDEVLGGYVRYRPLRHPLLMAAARPILARFSASSSLPRRLRKLGRLLALGTMDDCVLYNTANVLPSDLAELGMAPARQHDFRRRVLAEAKALYPGEAMRQGMYSDQHTFLCSLLDRNDRMTMSASIECRVPFLDYRLVEGLAAMPSAVLLAGRESKQLLRDSSSKLLPKSVLSGRKWGFGVPWTRYLRTMPELRELVRRLPDQTIFQDSPLEPARLRRVINEFLSGSDRYEALIYELTMIALWHDAYFSQLARLQQTTGRAPAYG